MIIQTNLELSLLKSKSTMYTWNQLTAATIFPSRRILSRTVSTTYQATTRDKPSCTVRWSINESQCWAFIAQSIAVCASWTHLCNCLTMIVGCRTLEEFQNPKGSMRDNKSCYTEIPYRQYVWRPSIIYVYTSNSICNTHSSVACRAWATREWWYIIRVSSVETK